MQNNHQSTETEKQQKLYELILLRNGGDKLYANSDWEQVRDVIHETEAKLLKKVMGMYDEMEAWPEPYPGAGKEIGPLYGAGMYAQYDHDKKKHEAQISEFRSRLQALAEEKK